MNRLLLLCLSLVFCQHAADGSDLKVEPSEYTQFYALYKDIDHHGEPIFVSVDCILHTFHLLYDYSLRDIETNYLAPRLDTLLDLMVKKARALTGRYGDPALRNLAYFSIARKLLRSDYKIDNSVVNLANQELELIMRHKGFEESPIFQTNEDFSQFVPRGHYTRSERLKSYFMAMAYLGRMGFYVHPRKGELAKTHMIRALLIMEILDGDAHRLWDEIYKITGIYVGHSDDLGPDDFQKLLNDSFPNQEPAAIIRDEKALSRFVRSASRLRRPRIISTFTRDDEDVYLASMSFKFMGQRFIPDGYIFQNLVYNKVGTRGNPRLFPKGLDVAAVLGSRKAFDIMIKDYKENRFLNYKKQLSTLQDEFSGLPEVQWQENLYWGWIAVIKDLIIPLKDGPRIFRTRTWIDKTLVTALAFWSELRHDAILYAKQSYTVSTVSIEKQKERYAYLEPRLGVYQRLKVLARMIPDKYLSGEIRARIAGFRELVDFCCRISEAELKGNRIGQKDQARLYGIGSTLEFLSQLPSKKIGMADADKTIEMIADVHTDVNTQKVLEVGVGKVDLIKIKIENRTYIGGIFSYYEFLQPMSDRLTDELWQKMSKPKRPEWQNGLLSF